MQLKRRWSYRNINNYQENKIVDAHVLAVPFEPAPVGVVLMILMIGARMPVKRLILLARASPVPR